MAHRLPTVDDLFGGDPNLTGAEKAERMDAFKASMPTRPMQSKAESVLAQYADKPEIVEALKAAMPEVTKDWTPTSPVTIYPYDLHTLQTLVPVDTTITNLLPRETGEGMVHEFRQIVGISGSGTGGASQLNDISFSSQTQTTAFGSVDLLRPGKISYEGNTAFASQKELGASDSVQEIAEYAGRGYASPRQASQSALLYAHLIGREQQLIYGSSTAAATVYVKVTAVSGFGESIASAQLATDETDVVTWTPVPGARGYNIYAADTSEAETFQSTVNSPSWTVPSTTLTTTGAVAPTVDTSGNAKNIDGILTVLLNPALVTANEAVNGVFNTSDPGVEFQNLFAKMYNDGANRRLARPKRVIQNALDRKQLADAIVESGNNTGFRILFDGTIGGTVSAIENRAFGDIVELLVAPYWPQGVAWAMCDTVPVPNSEVSAPFVVRSTVAMQYREWPQIQMTYDSSTYELATLVPYAPGWAGVLTGITQS
jgi:hypothetical protein